MDPFTLAMMASAGVNAIGKLMGGASASAMDKIQANAYGVQAGVAQTNTDLLNTQADVAGMGVDFAGSKERQALGAIEEAGRQTLSAQRSYFAGNNLDPTFGSPLLVQALTAGRVATDRNLAEASFAIDKANALSNVAALRGQAAGSAGQALTSLYGQMGATIKASADMTAGVIGAATSLLSGVGAAGKGGFSFPSFSSSGGGGGTGFSTTTTGGLY